MSIFTGLEDWWKTTEADVIAVVAKVISGVEAAEAEIVSALGWLANNAGTISADVQEVTGAITTITSSGIITNASINNALITAAADANKAVAALNATASAVQAGGTTVQAVVAGYGALVSAQSAVANAKQALVSVAPAP